MKDAQKELNSIIPSAVEYIRRDFYQSNIDKYRKYFDEWYDNLTEIQLEFWKKKNGWTNMLTKKNYKEFISLVRKMREAQKQWRDGDPFDFTETELAKRMQESEREVDEWLKKM